MASNLLSDFNDDLPSLTPQNTANLIDFDSPTSDGLKTSSEDLSTSNQLEDHFDLLTSGHKMSDSHQINTNYDDQFADLLGDISENGLHNDVLNKNNTADSDHLTVGDSLHEQHEEVLISTDDNRLSCASFSLSPPPSELNPSMTEDLDDMMLADFPDTSAPKAEMEDDTDDDISGLGQGSPIHQTGVATELDHLISLHPQQGLIDDDKMYENDALVPGPAPIDKSDDDISEVIMERDDSSNDVIRDADRESVTDGSRPSWYASHSNVTTQTSADQETYWSKYTMQEVDNSDMITQTTHRTWQSEYTHDTKHMTSSDSEAQHSADSTEGQRLEDRLADYQPPKRISKNEKDVHCGPSVYITGGAGSDNMCKRCKKRVYEMEKMIADKDIYHKLCFRCMHCNRILSFGNFAAIDGQPYCKPHFIELFKKRGQYDTITTEARADIISDVNRSDGDVAEYDYENREDEPASQTYKEEPIHFEQMSSVRNMFESASKNSPDVVPARWSKPKNVEPEPKVIQQEVPKVMPEVIEEPQKEEDELPPPAITRNLVARFQGIQENDTSVHSGDRKPIHKITPPRDVLAHSIEEAQRNSEESWQEDGREQSPSPEIIKSGTEPYPASELPPPKMMQSVLAKFKSLEDLSTRAPVSPEQTPVKHASSDHRQVGYGAQTKAPTSSSIKHSDSLPAGANRFAEESVSVHHDAETNHCDKVEEEKELPDEGFTKNLLAKWRSLEESALPTRHRDTSVPSKQNKRSIPTRAHSLPAYTRTPEKYVVANRQQTARCQEDIKGDEYLDDMDGKRDIVRESDNNEEDYLPPPCFIKNILAKFQSLEVEAEHQAKETTQPSKKNFKWSVKEAPLISPSGIVWQEKRRQSSTDSDGHPSNHSPAHDISYCTEDEMYELHEQSDDPDADVTVPADETTNRDEELPPPSLTKNMLAKFRSLEGTSESVTSP